MFFSGDVKIWDRLSLGVYQQASAITEDEAQSSDKNYETWQHMHGDQNGVKWHRTDGWKKM